MSQFATEVLEFAQARNPTEADLLDLRGGIGRLLTAMRRRAIGLEVKEYADVESMTPGQEYLLTFKGYGKKAVRAYYVGETTPKNDKGEEIFGAIQHHFTDDDSRSHVLEEQRYGISWWAQVVK